MSPTFTQDARRVQLVTAAIDVLADEGEEHASLVRIAARAGVSRGVVHYHFGSRRALFDAVVAEVYAVGAREVSATAGSGAPRDRLESFMRRSMDFYARFPRHLAALGALYTSRDPDTPARDACAEHAAEMADLAGLLREGQAAGEMRDFDVTLMALTVRAVLDVGVGLVRHGGAPTALAGELWATVDAATGVGWAER